MTPDDPNNGPEPDPCPVLSGLGEDGLIQRIRAAAAVDDPGLLRPIGDDAAVASLPGKTLLTTDSLVENVHFRLDLTPTRLLGRKAAAVNLSDIAAMGGRARFALLALSAPAHFPQKVINEIMDGLIERLTEAGAHLIGGDVTRAPVLVMAVTLIGTAQPPAPVYRVGARPGDHLYVTGTLGDSALGLQRLLELIPPVTEEIIDADQLAQPIRAHLNPPARLDEGARLAGVARSMMDLSDGVMTDLPRLLAESNAPGAIIDVEALPLSESFRAHFADQGLLSEQALSTALAGGEDYELIFTARADQAARVERTGVPVTRIGRITSEPGVRLVDGQGSEVPAPPPLFEHFAKEPGE